MLLVIDENSTEYTLDTLFASYPRLVLYFYPKDNTPGCTREAHDFAQAYTTLQSLGYDVVGVSKDAVDSHMNFAQSCSLPFPLLADIQGVAHDYFDVIGEKKMFGKTYMGTIRSTFVVHDGVQVMSRTKVRPSGHAQQVVDWIIARKDSSA